MYLSLPSKTDGSFIFTSSGRLRFNDSLNFMNMSLDTIVETIGEEILFHTENSRESWELLSFFE